MTIDPIVYNGKEYVTRWVHLMNVEYHGQAENVRVADYELWVAIEDDYNDNVPEAVEIDNGIYYYCDSGFLAGEPTDDEIREYLRESLT